MMWNETLQCGWLMWIAEGEHGLIVMVPEGDCPDMTGCLKLAQALMPDVRDVQVYDQANEQALVARYVRDGGDGKWRALNVTRPFK